MKAVLLLALAGPVMAQEIKPCPEKFPVETVKIHAPGGWVGVVPPVLRLTGADLVEAEPDNGAMIGRRRKTRSGYEVEYRDLSAPTWLACRYGSLALAERLPDKTDQCLVTYTKSTYGGYDITTACRIKP